MEFWNLPHPDDAPAVIDVRDARQWNYADLRRDVEVFAQSLPSLGRKSIGAILARNNVESLAIYLAALRSGNAVMLLDSTWKPAILSELLATYRPDWVFGSHPDERFSGYHRIRSGPCCLMELDEPQDLDLHRDLAVLLTTSGSTGSPKLVRLTLKNLAANADSIAQYLHLTSGERPITSLPMSYSYGLSVVNSHLAAGACLLLTDDSVLQRGFWDALEGHRGTSFAGVPYTYQMLLQTGLLKSRGTALRMLTQAGGRLDEPYIRQMHELALRRGWKFFVMYGQTEATARISYVPFEILGAKIGSVGVAIPGGSLSVDESSGELIYRGSNVMMGYAERREDLGKGDELEGILQTGDLARQDEDGYFYITGRLKRFLKLFGKRFNLDDAEKVLARHCHATVACYGRDDLLLVAVENAESRDAIHARICETFDLPRPAVQVVAVPQLPRTSNGKLDYQRLSQQAVVTRG
jgi:acyl-CoA synthetase (AMP-forming)/AMP-acid ligase II